MSKMMNYKSKCPSPTCPKYDQRTEGKEYNDDDMFWWVCELKRWHEDYKEDAMQKVCRYFWQGSIPVQVYHEEESDVQVHMYVIDKPDIEQHTVLKSHLGKLLEIWQENDNKYGHSYAT